MKLYVGRLPFSTTDQDLTDLFTQVGQVVSATVVLDRETGRSRGFGFVEMSNDQEALDAITRLNNATVEGRTITVSEAHDRRDAGRGGGGRGSYNRDRRGGGGGGGGGGGYRDRY